MNNKDNDYKPSLIDIERAAWYARLAFGDWQFENNKALNTEEKVKSTFYVIP